MSSSDEFPDWSIFKERRFTEMPGHNMLSPAMEMYALLQRYSADAKNARKDIEAAYYEGITVAAKQAVYISQLEAALEIYEPLLKDASLQRVHRHLRIIKDQMLSVFLHENLEIILPINKPFDEVADLVHVDGWLFDEKFTSEMVAEVLEPIIYHKGNLVRMGRVVMGAPLDNATEQKTVANIEKRFDNGEADR